MRLYEDCRTTRFGLNDRGELKAGDLFVVMLDGEVVRAVRAFRKGEPNDDPDFCFVTVGPFGSEEPKGPMIYEPRALGQRPVLKLTGDVRFRPSLDVEHLRPMDQYGETDLVSKAVITECATLLGVVEKQGPGWGVAYLDVDTGELSFQRPEGRAMVSSRWDIVMHRDGEPPTVLSK